ncbi:Glycosyltransferase involved in cell wall bisynthesis [Shimia gijangensis]|uniref:Glycosyltransferase involved in cell wall bisynthesis n=1 Tax=Shimia gijangensis TaxID=1470563 RepID=A0A1M6JR94_9RHOB|nr:glycosyltransferase family 4 protein [Shimia gijangensis]SHJ49172.1 Glycosyltransferase involved in cell wall bisynthesis [Shimia gijangensis]
MARIAFFAPMKSPNHPVPSGDREMARNVMTALSDDTRGYDVTLVSEFRCYDGKGDVAVQDALFQEASAEASRLIALGGWSAWVTYHSYYKAPDLLGPVVSQAMGIPYIQIEATRAAKRLGGPWDRFARAADASCDAASAIFYLTEQDGEGLAPYRRDDQPQVRLHPFLTQEDVSTGHRPAAPAFLSVGMMRQGDKLASYQIIAEILTHLTGDWTYEIAGDGPARAEVEALFAPFGSKVRFLGQLDKQNLQKAYGHARAFLWPGVNEAFGMVYLEAQAAGVPVVAENRPGVRDVLPPPALSSVADTAHLAQSLSRLLNDADYNAERSAQARDLVKQRHLLGAARETLWSVLDPLLKGAT